MAQKDEGVHPLPESGGRIGHDPARIPSGPRQPDNRDPASASDEVAGRTPASGGQVCGNHWRRPALDRGDQGVCGEIQIVVAGHPGRVCHVGDPGESRRSARHRRQRVTAIGEEVRPDVSLQPRELRKDSQPGAGELSADLAEVAGVQDRQWLDGRYPSPASPCRGLAGRESGSRGLGRSDRPRMRENASPPGPRAESLGIRGAWAGSRSATRILDPPAVCLVQVGAVPDPFSLKDAGCETPRLPFR